MEQFKIFLSYSVRYTKRIEKLSKSMKKYQMPTLFQKRAHEIYNADLWHQYVENKLNEAKAIVIVIGEEVDQKQKTEIGVICDKVTNKSIYIHLIDKKNRTLPPELTESKLGSKILFSIDEEAFLRELAEHFFDFSNNPVKKSQWRETIEDYDVFVYYSNSTATEYLHVIAKKIRDTNKICLNMPTADQLSYLRKAVSICKKGVIIVGKGQEDIFWDCEEFEFLRNIANAKGKKNCRLKFFLLPEAEKPSKNILQQINHALLSDKTFNSKNDLEKIIAFIEDRGNINFDE